MRAHESDHRSTPEYATRLMLRLPVALPRTNDTQVRGVLKVRTGKDALIIASHGDHVWQEHHDHIRRAIRSYQRQRQHLPDDLKTERRRSKRNRQGIVERMGNLAEHQAHRMRSWLHEAAAHLVGYAQRQHFGLIMYDDSDKSFAEPFPWYELRQRIREKCELAGIEFSASAEVTDKPPLEDGKDK